MRSIPTATLHLDIFFGSDRGPRKWWMHPMFFTRYVFTADGAIRTTGIGWALIIGWLRPAVRQRGVYGHAAV
jgi:hypothetical protein